MQRAFDAKTFEEEKASLIQASSDAADWHQVKELDAELQKASREVLGDNEIALSCVGADADLLQYFDEALLADKNFILAALRKAGCTLRYASEELRADREVVSAAVRKVSYAMRYGSDELRGDKELVLAAVRKDGRTLQHASEELRGDREVVLEAVSSNGAALEHAIAGLRGDRDVVLASVRKQGAALQFASMQLRGDQEVVLAALHKQGRALVFARRGLLSDKDFLLLAARQASQSHPRESYNQASPGLQDVVSEETFCVAVASSLAIPGQPEPAPTLLVTLTRTTSRASESEDETTGLVDSFSAEAVSGFSGEEFVCRLARESREEEPTLNDLAKELISKLRLAGKMGERQLHIFINFLRADDSDPVGVTPWDCQLPLSHFLATSS